MGTGNPNDVYYIGSDGKVYMRMGGGSGGDGALELKDGDSDNRANVKAANTARTTATIVLATQEVGADGTVPPTGSLNTNAPFVTPTDGTTDLTFGTGVMAASQPVTIATDDTQFGSVGAASDVDGSIHGQLRYIGEAVDGLEATVPIPPFTHSSGLGNFTATYTSNVTITLAGAPATVSNKNLSSITVNTSAGTSARTFVNGQNGVSMSVSSNVITITGAGTPFASGDTYDVRLNLFIPGYDANLDTNKSTVQNPLWSRYTQKEAIINAAQELDASFTDLGAEIDMQGYNQLGIWLTVDIGTSTNVELRILHKHTSAGAEEYREIYLGNPAANVTTINLNDYQIGADSDQLFKINIPISATSPHIQLQVKDAADGDGQIDAAYITKAWGN